MRRTGRARENGSSVASDKRCTALRTSSTPDLVGSPSTAAVSTVLLTLGSAIPPAVSLRVRPAQFDEWNEHIGLRRSVADDDGRTDCQGSFSNGERILAKRSDDKLSGEVMAAIEVGEPSMPTMNTSVRFRSSASNSQ
jgi:hypothetical protein